MMMMCQGNLDRNQMLYGTREEAQAAAEREAFNRAHGDYTLCIKYTLNDDDGDDTLTEPMVITLIIL